MSGTVGESGAFAGAQLRVVRGTPDEDELAALVAGIVAARAATDDDGAGTRPAPAPWADHGRRLGHRSTPGADSWRWSLHS